MEPAPPPPLPTPRQMLTSLINSISSIPPLDPADQHSSSSSSSSHSSAAEDDSESDSTKPAPPRRPRQQSAAGGGGGGGDLLLGRTGGAYRPLLTTLHALFPTILLAALDLLDRGLVSRLEMQTDDAATSNVAYHVRSAVTARRRQRQPSSSSSKAGPADPTYAVRLGAWSCSCAAFAFSAFPGGGGRDPRDSGASGGLETGGGGGGWEFGGLSIDGREQQLGHGSGGDDDNDDGDAGLVEVRGVPCCKHLLACLLADGWPVARRCVAARRVSREELAGIMAGI